MGEDDGSRGPAGVLDSGTRRHVVRERYAPIAAGFEAAEVAAEDDRERFIRTWDDERDPSAFPMSAQRPAWKLPASGREA